MSKTGSSDGRDDLGGFGEGSLDPASFSEWKDSANQPLILGGLPGHVPARAVIPCIQRIRTMRDELKKSWIGLKDEHSGNLIEWLLAALVARENALLLGPPGTAKSQIAMRTFELTGLAQPQVDPALLSDALADSGNPAEWWKRRETRERQTQKFFHYLLARFTQPEELFGPIEISLLRQGYQVRVNFGLLTGAGVCAAFLDETFKASSSILNTLLTIINERLYPNWGGMVRSDLLMFIGASNEMPGGFSTGTAGVGSSGEDFSTLYAFLDRFAIRLQAPMVTATSQTDMLQADLATATNLSLRRIGAQFRTGRQFRSDFVEGQMPCVNDFLLLGRYLYQHLDHDDAPCPIAKSQRDSFRDAFHKAAGCLQVESTDLDHRRISWTVNTRRIGALYKIALAHALIRDNIIGDRQETIRDLGGKDLRVFNLIWDTPVRREDLVGHVRSYQREYLGETDDES